MDVKKIHMVIFEEKGSSSYIDAQKFQSNGAIVTIASTLDEVTSLCKSSPVNVILMNIFLSNKIVFEKIESLKFHPLTSSIPIVVSGVDVSEPIQEDLLRVGASLFVHYPIFQDVFLEKIKDLLSLPRRVHERIDLSDNNGEISIYKDDSVVLVGKVINISKTGMLVHLQSNLELNKCYECQVNLPGEEGVFLFTVRVVRIEKNVSLSCFNHGMAVEKLKSDSEMKFSKYLTLNSKKLKILKYYV